MNRRLRPSVKRLQDSVSYVPDAASRSSIHGKDRSQFFHELYPQMFIEDVRLSVMPIGGRVYNGKQFNVTLEPPDTVLAKRVASAISSDEYPGSLASEVSDFVAQCAASLLLFDTSTYELVYLSEENDDKLIGFEFVQINPFTLVKRGNTLQQRLPPELAAKLGKPQRIELKPERILTFTLPGNFPSKMDDVMELLSILSSPVAPDFYMKELTSGSMKTPYDVKAHIFVHKVALARATKFSGWNARLMFQEEALEYYLMHRNLIFERFRIELRDCILDTLNEGIKIAGDKLGFTTKVVITGLPTIDTIQAAFDHLQKGNVPFAEILEPFRKY